MTPRIYLDKIKYDIDPPTRSFSPQRGNDFDYEPPGRQPKTEEQRRIKHEARAQARRKARQRKEDDAAWK